MNLILNFDKNKYNDTLFIDRDGVINVLRPHDYVKNWSEFKFRPEFIESAKELASLFKRIIVITNQRGIGRGIMTEDDLLSIHKNMCKEISAHGGRIDAIYFCPAVDDSDPDRKPNIGMLKRALRDFPDINLKRSIMIGDSDSDMEFAENAKIFGVKV